MTDPTLAAPRNARDHKCECPAKPFCVLHGWVEHGGGEPDICQAHDHVAPTPLMTKPTDPTLAALTEALMSIGNGPHGCEFASDDHPDHHTPEFAATILAHPAMADLARKAAAADLWKRHANHLYWFFRMTMEGGPDGSDADEAVEQDARAAAAHVEKALGLDIADQNIAAIAAALEQGDVTPDPLTSGR